MMEASAEKPRRKGAKRTEETKRKISEPKKKKPK